MTISCRVPPQHFGGNVALIDGDIIRYQAASVSDKVAYHWTGHEPIRYKKDALAYGKFHHLDPEKLIKTISPEPVEYCLHTVKAMIHNIMDKTESGSARVFLTGKGNYREDIDSRHKYKGQRPPHKPTHFGAVGDYLVKTFHAEVIEGMEADDAMGIAQMCGWKEVVDIDARTLEYHPYTCICTTDKDLKMIPGWHYNFQKDEKFWVDPDEADRFFYTQLLTGDSVDNIKGIKGVGMKTAEKILQDVTTCTDMYTICLEQYELAGLSYYDLLENANLLWIQREEGVLWTPPNN